MTSTRNNPARRAAKLAQLTTKHARQAVSAASRGYTASARLHIQSAATFNQRAAEIDPAGPSATRANAEYAAACARLTVIAGQRQTAGTQPSP